MGSAVSSTPQEWDRLAFSLGLVTERGALVASEWCGRGRSDEADQATAHAMRSALEASGTRGVVVCGEGEKDGVAHLGHGERFGDGASSLELDLAIDPIDGTTRLGMGLGGAISVLAAAPRGSMFDPGPAYYMEKLVAGPAAQGDVDPEADTSGRLTMLARALGKPIEELTVFVLDKPRHRSLIAEIRAVGARAAVHPAGDVEGALRAVTPSSGIDALMGTGGTPEGLIAACAVRALGGVFFGRLDPQRPDEADRVREAGLSATRWLSLPDIIRSDYQIFAASGITAGPLLDGISQRDHLGVQTLLIVGRGGEGARRHVIDTSYPHAQD